MGWPLEDDEPNPEPPNPEPTAPSIPDALARWLEETAPKYGRTIVFLCGTGNPRHASDFFAAAAAIVARMNKSYRDRDLPSKFRVIVDETKRTRAVFLTAHPEVLPVGIVDGEIEGAFHCEYADLDALLPECTAIVHGGGVGTRRRSSSARPRSISTTTVNVSRVAAWARSSPPRKSARRAGQSGF